MKLPRIGLICVLFSLLTTDGLSDRPNFVLIMADDMGYECVAANGGLDYKTPRLDQMAADGLRFEHCYSQPICTPSRVKLMTGLSNKRNYVKFGVLNRKQTTFAHLLKRAGYATCISGKWQLGKQPDSPQHFGFDRSLLWQHTRGRTDKQNHDTRFPNPHLERNGKRVDYEDGEFSTDLFVSFIEDFIGEQRDGPFLVYYPMALVHCPFGPTPHSDDWDPTSRGSKTYKGDPQYFGDMVAYADQAVGRIFDCLKQNGVLDNTLVMFVGDNGTDTPIVTNTNYGWVVGAKGQTIDGGNHVPCIMKWPKGIRQNGRTCKDIVDFSDFLPTMCELANAPTPETLDGKSLVPHLEAKPGTARRSIFQWYERNGVPKKAVEFARTQRYKLYATGEFYDVPFDRLEQTPLEILTPKQQAIKAELQQQIDRYRDIVHPKRAKIRRLG